mmetsp:Transcript_8416/g.15897  ORF Transcript_8416/g.15897 Transcript_8416/m.15897 type:complete len:96 (+) Transcript_8416:1548-1835(+)
MEGGGPDDSPPGGVDAKTLEKSESRTSGDDDGDGSSGVVWGGSNAESASSAGEDRRQGERKHEAERRNGQDNGDDADADADADARVYNGHGAHVR